MYTLVGILKTRAFRVLWCLEGLAKRGFVTSAKFQEQTPVTSTGVTD